MGLEKLVLQEIASGKQTFHGKSRGLDGIGLRQTPFILRSGR